VGEVGRAFEGDEPVPAAACVIDAAQPVRRLADVVQRKLEEERLGIVDLAASGCA
jgi:hypothetical protein